MTCCLKIAVADDDRDTREYLEEYLAHLGHEVRSVGDGQQLVELCRELAPDLVVTDHAMPRLDGLAAAFAINDERPVPIILISGREDVGVAAESAAFVVRYLTKPIKNSDLKAAIESLATRGVMAGGSALGQVVGTPGTSRAPPR